MSSFIIGPDDKPPVHGEEEEQQDEEEEELNMDELTKEQKLMLLQRKQGINVLGIPHISRKGITYSILILILYL